MNRSHGTMMSATQLHPRIAPWLVAGLAVLLAACSSNVVRSPQATDGKSNSVSSGRSGASVVVERGDTLYSIARRNQVAVSDLARWNNLPEPYTIYPGQRLWLGQSGGRNPSTRWKSSSVPWAPRIFDHSGSSCTTSQSRRSA